MKKTITILICCLALGVPATLQAAPKSKPGTSVGVFSEKFTKVVYNIDIRLQAETAQQTSDGGFILAGSHQYKDSAAWLLKLDANGDNKAESQMPIGKFFGIGNEYKLGSKVNRYDGDGRGPLP